MFFYTFVFNFVSFNASFKSRNTNQQDKKEMKIKFKYLVLIWSFLTASTFCQKCMKPKVSLLYTVRNFNGFIKPMFRAMLVIQSRTRNHLATKESVQLLTRGLRHGSDILICELCHVPFYYI